MKPHETHNDLIRFDTKHYCLIGGLVLIFLIGVIFKIHGYSITMWHEYIDGSEKKEILLGKDRPIRSDDWAVEIPLMLSQLSHQPKFPLINTNIGTGMNMMTHSKVAILHPITIFRPSVWGFFIGPGYGLSWMWWTMVIGLFYVYFLIFMIISKNQFTISLGGSVFLLFSSFFQFWSFHKSEIPIFMGLSGISCIYLLVHSNKKIVIAHTILLGWALSCFALHFIYPAHQVPCAYLLIFMIFGILLNRYPLSEILHKIYFRMGYVIISLGIVIIAMTIFYVDAKQVIEVMKKTEYPGNRFCTGGDYLLWSLFKHNFLSLAFVTNLSDINWNQLGNICEGSSFIFVFPPMSFWVIWNLVFHKKMDDKFTLAVLIYCSLMIIFLVVGFPAIISKYSLFYLVTSNRAIIGLGIANALVLVSFLSQQIISANRLERFIISFLWTSLLFYSGLGLVKNFDLISIKFILPVSVINGVISYYLFDISRKKEIICMLAGISFFAGSWFNPIVVDGTSFIYNNELSKKIIAIDHAARQQSHWVIFSDWVTPNLFRMIGVNAINGTHNYPLFSLWKELDKDGKYFREYNRYGQVRFNPSEDEIPVIHSPSPDVLAVNVNPCSPILDKLGITHILVKGQNTLLFDNCVKLQQIFNDKGVQIYKVSSSSSVF